MQRDREIGQEKAAVDKRVEQCSSITNQEIPGPTEAGRGKAGFFPKISARRMALPIPWFEIMASRTERKDFCTKLPS